MEAGYVTDPRVVAYVRLLELNMTSWKPEIAEWLHSEDAEAPLRELLEAVPCSLTLH